MEEKHTRGPWEPVTDRQFSDLPYLVLGAGTSGAKSAEWMPLYVQVGGHSGLVEQKANTLLIAAAPELLAALKKVAQSLEWHAHGFATAQPTHHRDTAATAARDGELRRGGADPRSAEGRCGMKRIYISGPMSGLPNHNFPAFNAAAEKVRAQGIEAVNPAEINADTDLSWEECLRADIKALCDCDTIAMLPGWENSKGAHLEVHVAHRLGIKVVRIEDIAGGEA